MKVLAICAHPDDVELSCSGTLIKCKQRGDDVVVCHALDGGMGHMIIEASELIEIRKKEAAAAAELAGFQIIHGDIKDLCANSCDEEQIKKIVKVIRDVKPDFIITHPENDYVADHTEVSKLVFKASFSASVPHFCPELGEATKTTPIFYTDGQNGVNTIPTEYVNITDVIDLKAEMQKKHESQIKWVLEHDNIDIVDKQRAVDRARGLQCGARYAEAFTQLRVVGRMKTFRLLP